MERLNSARIALDDQMATMMARRSDAEKRAWKQEMALGKTIKELEEIVDKYNATLVELGGHPAVGKALRQANVTLRVDAQNTDAPITPDLKGHVWAVLRSLQDQLEHHVQALQSEQLRAQAHITQLNDNAGEKEEDCSQLERSGALLEQQYLQEKEVRS